jgi:predicted SAM-dependent methyltransferase
MNMGLDLGSPKGMTPFCIHTDIFGSGAVHPFYGGGRYLADVVHDAGDVSIFPTDAWSYIASNHSLEHMNVPGDEGTVDLLERWVALLRQGGVLAMVIPDNDHFDVLASDRDHRHAWGAKDFRTRVLDRVLEKTGMQLVEYDTLDNHFSFNVILRKT